MKYLNSHSIDSDSNLISKVWSYQLEFYWTQEFVDSSPFIGILPLPPDYIETLKDVDDVIDASPFDLELFGALI